MASISGKRQSVTVAERLKILQKLEEGVSVDNLVAEYGVSKRTIRRYKKNSTSLRQLSENPMRINSKRQRTSSYESMESRLYEWILERRASGDIVTNALLQEKAKELQAECDSSSTFTASQGWLSRFKNRHNLHLVNICDDKIDTNELAAQKFINELVQMLRHKEFDEENIYNINDCSLMWRTLPTKILTHEGEQLVSSTRIKRSRVSVAFCANVTGKHKLPLLFINKFADPIALKHCKHRLPVVYKYQSNSLINEQIFSDWYHNHFKLNVRQHQLQEHREGKVLLLVNNFWSHMIPEEIQEDNYFKLMFLPPSIPFAQPVDGGIITKCKTLFRYELLRRVLQYGHGIREFYANYDVKDCIDIITESWNKITAESIKNSWRHLLKQKPLVESPETDDSDSNIDQNFKAIMSRVISSEQIAEWMSESEKAESILEKNIEHEAQKASASPYCSIEEEELDNMFHNLVIWSETEPEFIHLHVEALINYYNGT